MLRCRGARVRRSAAAAMALVLGSRLLRAAPSAAWPPSDARTRAPACAAVRARAVPRAPALRLAGAVNALPVRLAAACVRPRGATGRRSCTRCCAAADASGEARTIGSAALALALCNMCRVAMSVAILPVAPSCMWRFACHRPASRRDGVDGSWEFVLHAVLGAHGCGAGSA